jgi:hypothetical protein
MTESMFSYTGKLNSTDLFTVRGNSVSEFRANLNAAVEAIAEAVQLQASLVGRVAASTGNAYTPNAEQAIQMLQDAGLNPQPVTPGTTPQSIEVVKDKYGNEWTYGHPDAPDLPDGRGKYAKKKGVSKAGKAYVGWFDPAKGPKAFKPGAVEAETIWAKG